MQKCCCRDDCRCVLRGPPGPPGPRGIPGVPGTGGGGITVFLNSGGAINNEQFMRFGNMIQTESKAQIVMTKSGKIKNLTVSLTAPPGEGTREFVLRKNGFDTSLMVSMSGSTEEESNVTNVIPFVKFDKISVICRTQGLVAPATGIISFEA